MPVKHLIAAFAVVAAATLLPLNSVRAEIVLSQLVVELQPGKAARQDIEILNKDKERAYVVAEPRSIIDPGTLAEKSLSDPDPEKLGLLVSPGRMILEPQQHRLLRFAAIGEAGERERVYRVTVKPVIGELDSEQSGLKVLVGYDVLVLVRPVHLQVDISATRAQGKLVWRNNGNVSVELTDGRQCTSGAPECAKLPGKRLYAGMSWTVDLSHEGPVTYQVRSPAGTKRHSY